MSVKLRLRRMGKKKQAFYRIVAITSRNARNGRYIENLGTYNPITDPAEINLKEERVLYWLQQGAIPSDTVRTFLKKQGVLLKWHLMKQGADDAAIDIELKKWEAQQIEREKKKDALLEQQKREKKSKKEEKTGEEAKAAVESSEEAVEDVADVEPPQASEKQPAETLPETSPDAAASADAVDDVDVAAQEETIEDAAVPEAAEVSTSAKEDVVEQAAPEKPKKKTAKNSKKTEEVKTDAKATEEEPASEESPISEPDKGKKTDTDK